MLLQHNNIFSNLFIKKCNIFIPIPSHIHICTYTFSLEKHQSFWIGALHLLSSLSSYATTICAQISDSLSEDDKNKDAHKEAPCTDAPSGRSHYVYPDKNFRMYTGIVRGSDEWNSEYALRAGIERTFSSLKANECVANPRTLNLASIRSDICLAACTQVITLILAYCIKKPDFLKSISKLIRFSA